ncbi:MAG: hypothetical protein ABJC04_03505 [Verrucomicrobiota bacterium]
MIPTRIHFATELRLGPLDFIHREAFRLEKVGHRQTSNPTDQSFYFQQTFAKVTILLPINHLPEVTVKHSVSTLLVKTPCSVTMIAIELFF